MSHQYFLWMSYGATGVAIVVELVLLAAARRRARRAVDEERDLETQD